MARKRIRDTDDWLDCFCGAGGSTTGIKAMGGHVRVALNHNRQALESHAANHPEVEHELADVQASDPRWFPGTRRAWFSPECTKHSLAAGLKAQKAQLDMFDKGIQDPNAERSRATAWDVVRFAEYWQYDLFIVENVVEFRTRWVLYDAWLTAIHALGYETREVYLNSMFAHPVPQSRDRYYLVAWRRCITAPDLEIRPQAFCPQCERDVEAAQCWKNPRRPWGKYRAQYTYNCPRCASVVEPYYYAALNAIDFDLPIQAIGERARPLREKTLRRVRAGLERFAGAPFITEYHDARGGNERVRPVTDALPTQDTSNRFGLAQPFMVDLSHTDDKSLHAWRLTEPCPTQTTAQTGALVLPFLVRLSQGEKRGDAKVYPVTAAAPTQTARQDLALAQPVPFIVEMRGNSTARRITEALSTVTAGGGHHGLAVPAFIVSYYGTGGAHALSEALPTQPTHDRHALVEPGPQPDLDRALSECGFRMLSVSEIKAAMGFASDYILVGDHRGQVKQLGNAVTPQSAGLLVERAEAVLR